ncbi:MAG: kynureninase [Parvibaculaceae bacterium]
MDWLPARLSREFCAGLDVEDPFSRLRDRFLLPEGLIYLDGNSLGPLQKGVGDRLRTTLEAEWGKDLISSWNLHGWFDLPRKVGERLARLVGAEAGSVIVGDTISVDLFKLLGAALALKPDRKVILSDTGNFPSDLYIAQGVKTFLDRGHELRLVEPEQVEHALDGSIAVLMLTEVDYRTGRLHDMARLTAKAHAAGALTIWDLAHSAGAIPVDLSGAGADFAVGCTYKFLNGGPGAPAFLYVRPGLQERISTPLAGWWGHAAPFAFDLDYRPASGIARMQCGTQPVLSLAALDAALDVWQEVDMPALAAKARRLCGLFIRLIEDSCARHGLALAGPRDLARRGSQVSFRCPEGYAVIQALIANGVVGDFRAPDIIRFGVAPLYTRYVDIWDAATTLARVLDERLWDTPAFRARKPVT